MPFRPSRRSILQLAASCGVTLSFPLRAARSQTSFNIFFDFQSTLMSGAATELADRLAQEIMPAGRVMLVGHADTAEAQPERLSYARGNEVLKHFLRKQALVRVRFDVVSGGVSTPLIRTGPNIQEPRNRRVEVILG